MNWMDIAFVAVIALSVLGGFVRGLARELFGLAGLVVGFFLGLLIAPDFAPTFHQWLGPQAGYAAAFFLVFIATILVAEIAGRILTLVLKIVQLSFANRFAGGAFGLVRGMLMIVVLFMGFTYFGGRAADLAAESKIAPWAYRGALLLADLLPEDHRLRIHDAAGSRGEQEI